MFSNRREQLKSEKLNRQNEARRASLHDCPLCDVRGFGATDDDDDDDDDGRDVDVFFAFR